MQKAVTEVFGKAAYEARCKALITGAYPKSAIRVPDQEHFYQWDEIPIAVEDAVKWLYRKEGQAAVEAFFAYIVLNGSPEAKYALNTMLREMNAVLFTDEEQAEMVSGEDSSQRSTSPREITTLGKMLRQLPSAQIRPTETLYLILGKYDWMSSKQAWDHIAKSRYMDLDWDAYLVKEGQMEPQGIYLFGPGGQVHRAFEVRIMGVNTWTEA